MNTTETAIAARRAAGRELPLVLATKDVARLFGAHVRTVRRWRLEGKLPPVLPFRSRILRWRRDDILVLLTGGPHAQ